MSPLFEAAGGVWVRVFGRASRRAVGAGRRQGRGRGRAPNRRRRRPLCGGRRGRSGSAEAARAHGAVPTGPARAAPVRRSASRSWRARLRPLEGRRVRVAAGSEGLVLEGAAGFFGRGNSAAGGVAWRVGGVSAGAGRG